MKELTNVFSVFFNIRPDSDLGRLYIVFSDSKSYRELLGFLQGDLNIDFILEETIIVLLNTELGEIRHNTGYGTGGFREIIEGVDKLELTVGVTENYTLFPFSGQEFLAKKFQII